MRTPHKLRLIDLLAVIGVGVTAEFGPRARGLADVKDPDHRIKTAGEEKMGLGSGCPLKVIHG